jgi:hypothetical protein
VATQPLRVVHVPVPTGECLVISLSDWNSREGFCYWAMHCALRRPKALQENHVWEQRAEELFSAKERLSGYASVHARFRLREALLVNRVPVSKWPVQALACDRSDLVAAIAFVLADRDLVGAGPTLFQLRRFLGAPPRTLKPAPFAEYIAYLYSLAFGWYLSRTAEAASTPADQLDRLRKRWPTSLPLPADLLKTAPTPSEYFLIRGIAGVGKDHPDFGKVRDALRTYRRRMDSLVGDLARPIFDVSELVVPCSAHASLSDGSFYDYYDNETLPADAKMPFIRLHPSKRRRRRRTKGA